MQLDSVEEEASRNKQIILRDLIVEEGEEAIMRGVINVDEMMMVINQRKFIDLIMVGQ